MSVSREVTVWCDYDGCGEWTYGGGANYTAAKARAGAKSEGWRRVGGLDICPRHSQVKRLTSG